MNSPVNHLWASLNFTMCYLLFVILLPSVVKDDRRLLVALFRFACCGAAELFGCYHKVRILFFSNNVALCKSEFRAVG